MLEANLDRYPTREAMLGYLSDLMLAVRQNGTDRREPEYFSVLKYAIAITEAADDAVEAIATLHGYQNFTAQRSSQN